VITSLLENVVILETIKKRGELPLGATSLTFIQGHAPCLSGRRPSSAVHHFGRRVDSPSAPRRLPSDSCVTNSGGATPLKDTHLNIVYCMQL